MQLNIQKLSLSALVITFSLSVTSLWLGLSKSREKFGLVDMSVLLAEQSQKLAKAYPTGQVPKGIMQQVIEEIKTVISEYGQIQKVTLLAKGAVLSGDLPDYTEIFKDVLSEGKPQTTRRKS